MKMEVRRDSIVIIPESELDEAFLEEVLGLREAGDSIPARRKNAMGLSCWAYLEIMREEEEDCLS